jgi:tetratricopeptide (TPR) repeat protein
MPQDERDGLLPASADAVVQRIRQALAANDLDRARRGAKELATREPGGFEAAFWNGYVALRQARYYDAIRALRRAEALNPSPSVLKVLALSYSAAHQQRLFLLKMREAQQKQPSDFAPYYYLGRYFETEESDWGRAAEYFERALARRPDHARGHSYLGHCYEEQQKPEQAEAEYRRAMELADGQHIQDSLPYQGLARLRLAANRAAEAVPFAQRAVEIAARDAAAHKLLARAYAETGRDAEAAAEWRASSALDPTDASTLYRLYRSYVSLGDGEKARAALEDYRRIAALYGTN